MNRFGFILGGMTGGCLAGVIFCLIMNWQIGGFVILGGISGTIITAMQVFFFPESFKEQIKDGV